MSRRELATILAALRYWQRTYVGGPEDSIATDREAFRAMSGREIDALCLRLNANARVTHRATSKPEAQAS